MKILRGYLRLWASLNDDVEYCLEDDVLKRRLDDHENCPKENYAKRRLEA